MYGSQKTQHREGMREENSRRQQDKGDTEGR